MQKSYLISYSHQKNFRQHRAITTSVKFCLNYFCHACFQGHGNLFVGQIFLHLLLTASDDNDEPAENNKLYGAISMNEFINQQINK